ncbi:type I-G CRISPR-associated protein Cas8g1/Csx17 [Azospirillum thermophilum]|uniref:Type I-U CRISPR-associated protein Csx17 n=1 Tax=Azospirillum thermophilum TaxID=2202148 RepID=A0A2S2CKC4_9PROT|nr:type I-U CRISPR-associated protein Csx17 [Azospirillum thermophilum]AWK84922.1 type I-U CRISPR-associated protein Csx17 [Azospirillum thermophilum]
MGKSERHEHVLNGCAPVPLAGYLKALGVLRLIAEHPVAGQADKDVAGWWRDEAFHLRTRLTGEELLSFFLDHYRPSAVVAPWNGGSGFFAGDNRDGFAPLRDSPAERFAGLRAAMEICERALADAGLVERPQGEAKLSFVLRLRGQLPDEALIWIDAALALSRDDLLFPPLLGTGGNDGRLDFTNNFMRRLVSSKTPRGLFDAQTGAHRPEAVPMLRAALFGDATDGLTDAAIGQFAPGAAGGPNSTAGFEGAPNLNPWDFVLMIEGALLFAGALTRRNESARQSGASFPFTVKATGAGWGGIGVEDEDDARAEFWAPLWSRPATAAEIRQFLAEGRAVLNGRTARDGLEFARAAAALGTSRGIDAFQRYGFVMRAGKAYLATPLGRRRVTAVAPPAVALIAELEEGHWLERVRYRLRKGEEGARARILAQRLDDALFALTEPGAGKPEVQAALIALGAVARYLAVAPKARETVPPPPALSPRWLSLADDGSPEFHVAAALASLGHPPPKAAEDDRKREDPILPVAAHVAPLDLTQPFKKGPAWYDEKRRKAGARDGRLEVVWGDGDLTRNLIAMLNRRLIGRTGREEGVDDTLCASTGAPLSAVLAFLDTSSFVDARCAALLAGLVWVRPGRWRLHSPGRDSAGRGWAAMPLPYAVLKPLFTPADRLHQERTIGERRRSPLPRDHALPIPSGLVARLLRGEVAPAVRDALLRAHASGIASPFLDSRVREGTFAIGAVDPRRLAAALLIPIDDNGLDRVIERAYPQSNADANADTETADHAA